MSAYRRINRGSRSLHSSLLSCASSTETISNSITAVAGATASSNSTSNLSDSLVPLNGPSSNGSVDASIKPGGQLVATSASTAATTAAAIKYDELQMHGNKYEHELAINGNGIPSCLPQPKHIRFPDVPYSSELVNELMIFMYTMIATAMQFLHLYRTVWWLPESNTSQTMNFYLIDEHLTLFIVILLGRRFLYCFLIGILEMLCPKRVYHVTLKFIRLTFFIGILSVLGFLCYQMFPKQRYIVIYLCYPMIVYVITFGLHIEPFLRTIFETDAMAYFNGIPTHSCSTNPVVIRAEIDVLRTDYNNRFKQVVFTSLLNAYYAAFIPCCFAQSFLYYDLYWATQHLGFLILGGFTMCTMFCFPANYCDVMHMASLHLGKWVRIESRSYAPPTVIWTKTGIWPTGQFVKHSGELFKSYGIVTTAIPGNGIHIRFYMFFQNPSNIYLVLSIVQSTIVILQVIILFMVVEWHNIISLSYLVLANYHTLFRIVRDFFVTHRMYSASSSSSSANPLPSSMASSAASLPSSTSTSSAVSKSHRS